MRRGSLLVTKMGFILKCKKAECTNLKQQGLLCVACVLGTRSEISVKTMEEPWSLPLVAAIYPLGGTRMEVENIKKT